MAAVSLIVFAAARAAAAAASAEPVADAARRHDVAAVRALVASGADVNVPGVNGATALHWAVHHDDPVLTDLLIAAGARVDAANDYGVQPLAIACLNANPDLVDRLLLAGASARTTQAEGETVLMVAARTGNVEVVRKLLQARADVNAAEQWRGQTALMWAAAEGHTEVVRLLITAGASLEARAAAPARTARARAAPAAKAAGLTAVAFAVRGGHLATTRALLDAGAVVHDRTPAGNNLLHLAIMNAHFELARLLLERGASASETTAAGVTPLHHVVQMRRPLYATRPAPIQTGSVSSLDLMQTLIARGAVVDAGMPPPQVRRPLGEDAVPPPGGGATPLWLAARGPDVEAMRLLMAAGADPQVRTDDGVTLLMTAAGIGFRQGTRPKLESEVVAAIALAIEHGGDVNAEAHDGSTALHGAALRGVNAAVSTLLAHGAYIDARDKAGRMPVDVAEDASDARSQPETAALLRKLMSRPSPRR